MCFLIDLVPLLSLIFYLNLVLDILFSSLYCSFLVFPVSPLSFLLFTNTPFPFVSFPPSLLPFFSIIFFHFISSSPCTSLHHYQSSFLAYFTIMSLSLSLFFLYTYMAISHLSGMSREPLPFT